MSSLLDRMPLFAGIERAALEGFLRVFQAVEFAPGSAIMRQGQPADGAYILESGTADVVTALPGGGEAGVATIGPGSVLGEMALLESGARSATVLARSKVAGHFIEREGFRMLLSQRNRAAFTIQGRITRTLCQRLRDLNGRVAAHEAPAGQQRGGAILPSVPAAQPLRPSFDYKSFLHLLPLFRRFGAAEIAQFAEQAQGIELDRGQVLFRQGEASEAGYVVVRGAVEISAQVNGYRHRIGILGPGRFCGVLALIEGEIHSMGATARERATLLALPRSAFERLFVGDDRLSFLFQDAINRELLQALARTNIHLTRLISQARIRDGGMEGRKAVELQCVLGAQDCRAAGA